MLAIGRASFADQPFAAMGRQLGPPLLAPQLSRLGFDFFDVAHQESRPSPC